MVLYTLASLEGELMTPDLGVDGVCGCGVYRPRDKGGRIYRG